MRQPILSSVKLDDDELYWFASVRLYPRSSPPNLAIPGSSGPVERRTISRPMAGKRWWVVQASWNELAAREFTGYGLQVKRGIKEGPSYWVYRSIDEVN